MKKTLTLCLALISFCSLAQKKDIALEDIWQNNTFAPKRIGGIVSMKNGEHYTTLGGRDAQYIVMYDYKTGNAVDTVLKSSWLKVKGMETGISIEGYAFSEDESKLLISDESEQIYRHSTRENYYIYDRKTKKTTFISANGKQMYAEFSPDAKHIGFVRDNNLFMYEVSSGREEKITTDGKVGSIINGATDWVYEEEFSFDKAWCWAPDGDHIAYYRFDESNVKEFSMNKYGTLYPTEYRFKYPKAGEVNSKVDIFICDVKTGSRLKVDLGTEYEYIPRIKWTSNPQSLSIQRMNRLQNKLELVLADAKTGMTKTILTETSDTYIEISDHLTFLGNGSQFIWSSDKDGFNHLYLYDMTGKQVNQITKGNWDVKGFLGCDEKAQSVYYTSSQLSPANTTLYSARLDGTNSKRLYATDGTDAADFSASYAYYILTHADANHPPVCALYSADGALVRMLEDNSALQKKIGDYTFVQKEFFTFKTSAGTELNGWMMKPSNFSAQGKYPVLMYVYGGPGSNTVNNSWDRDFIWYQMLCGRGYIVVSVDNRGTGGRGKKFRDCTYKQLGKFETEDQIEGAKYLGNLPYVDKSRIGIWGWSYGGYMSSLCIFKGAETFKMAMAVAPVTNWRYYDNVYTERYMALPKDNGLGYDDNSPINHVEKLKGKFLLVHGTADDNVHFQNSVEMITALVKANKQFEFFAYPDKAHGISGARLHLYNMLTNFIFNNL